MRVTGDETERLATDLREPVGGPAKGGAIRAAAARVLTTEAEALTRLAAALPQDFAPTVQAILASQGRVIVSGVGKSGHIGRKIAATLASTGTPALFVHGAEASHGDLGMIAVGDICLLISNSGETAEIGDLLYYTRRFSIPLIGMSSDAGSTLMQAADFRLTLPRSPEACAIGMAPTTSTTLALALGDALAVTLMELRGFRSEDFGVFHPGGKLGAQMRRVGSLMHCGEAVPVVADDTPMQEVLLTMSSKGFGIAAVIGGDGALAGVITDGDLRRHISHLMEACAGEIANAGPVTVTADCLAPEALALINRRKVSALIVVDAARRPEGVLHVHDLLRAGVL